jgi:hypothetical protein
MIPCHSRKAVHDQTISPEGILKEFDFPSTWLVEGLAGWCDESCGPGCEVILIPFG